MYNNFNQFTLDQWTNKKINSNLGELYICREGILDIWTAKKFEEGKKTWQMKTVYEDQNINTFCFWLNSITA